MSKDRDLGMNRKITRRDFMEGAGLAIAGSMLPGSLLAAGSAQGSKPTGYYPPSQTGLRGSHVGSFEVAHELARGGRTDWGPVEDADGMVYDLVVVGAGISGLSAAYFYKKEHPDATILILDNHDDFGGHAKRNEFDHDGKKMIGYGGSQTIAGPDSFSSVAKGLLKDLQVDVARFETAYDRDFVDRHGLGPGIYFDRETYGVDRVVRGAVIDYGSFFPLGSHTVPIQEAVPKMPISDKAKQELLALHSETKDRVPGWIFSEMSYLESISYREFLTKHMGVTEPQVLALLQYAWSDVSGMDVLPALWAMFMGCPGLDATDMGTFEKPMRWLAGDKSEPYIHHFPDGNASIPRLLVRRLIADVAPGNTMEDIVGAQFDYSRLDRPDSPVRLRLNSTVVNVQNRGDAKSAKEVDVTYVHGGKAFQVRARDCVLACYNRIIPHLCPTLPAIQKESLSALTKVPLVYTNVLLRNWQPWKKLGVSVVTCPSMYHPTVMLDFPVSLGSVEFSSGPDQPIIAHMNRMPGQLGLSHEDQKKAGRMELFTKSFESIEREIRSHFVGMLGAEGFDPAKDIEAITVNRWPHGYASYVNQLSGASYDDDELPYVVGRKRFGRIVIANSDAGGMPLVQVAIDQAHRACEELKG